MKFDFKDEFCDVVIGDKTYQVRYPRVSERIALQKKVNDPSTDILEFQNEWVASLGLPREVIDDLNFDQFNELASELSTPKKLKAQKI